MIESRRTRRKICHPTMIRPLIPSSTMQTLHRSDTFIEKIPILTKGDAVGPSRIASSSSVNGSRGMTTARNGMRSIMMMGNPMAAVRNPIRGTIGNSAMHVYSPMVCVMAIVAPNPINCTVTNRSIRDFRTRRKGSSTGVRCRSRRKYRSFRVIPLPCNASAPMYQLFRNANSVKCQ